MCDICHQTPCHPRCPGAPDPPRVFVCSGCGEDIREGDKVWHLDGEQFCQECIRNAKFTADNGRTRYELMGEIFTEVAVNAAEEIARLTEDWGDE